MNESGGGGACLTRSIVKGKTRAQSGMERVSRTVIPFILTLDGVGLLLGGVCACCCAEVYLVDVPDEESRQL